MSYQNIEIEKKYRLEKKNFESLKEYLTDTATFISDSVQIDEYFSTQKIKLNDNAPPIQWVSLRHRNGKHILNYKKYFPVDTIEYTYSKEYETILDNPIALSKVLKDFGFKLIVTVKKRRISFQYEDKFEISFDDVDGLGYFIEIEATKNQGGINNTSESIEKFAKSIGLQESDLIKVGYPLQILNLK